MRFLVEPHITKRRETDAVNFINIENIRQSHAAAWLFNGNERPVNRATGVQTCSERGSVTHRSHKKNHEYYDRERVFDTGMAALRHRRP